MNMQIVDVCCDGKTVFSSEWGAREPQVSPRGDFVVQQLPSGRLLVRVGELLLSATKGHLFATELSIYAVVDSTSSTFLHDISGLYRRSRNGTSLRCCANWLTMRIAKSVGSRPPGLPMFASRSLIVFALLWGSGAQAPQLHPRAAKTAERRLEKELANLWQSAKWENEKERDNDGSKK